MANNDAHDTRTTVPANRATQAVSLSVAAMSGAVDGLASNYPLEILQPEAGLTTTNRFYKAYPGFEYNVRMGVIGGKFPFMYSLPTAPAGMTINSSTGEINWPSPAASGTPYSVTANVTDAENTTRSVSWTVLVTTAGFLFVDAVNGTSTALGGTGTIGNPWKTIKDMYGGDTDAAMRADFHPGEFVYWRAGEYQMTGYLSDDGTGTYGDGMRMYFRGNTKPQVWLRYPGDAKPIFNQDEAHIYFESGGRDVWLDEMDFRSENNPRHMGMNIASSRQNVMIRRCDYSGIVGGFQGGNNALLFIKLWGLGTNFVIQGNTFSDVDQGYGILNYRTTKVLVEDNLFDTIGTDSQVNGHALGMKVMAHRWDVRSNTFRNNALESITLHYSDYQPDVCGDIEIRHNVVEAGGGDVFINQSFESLGLPVYTYRNTFMDTVKVRAVRDTNGPFYFSNNVIINDSSSEDNVTQLDIFAPSRVILTDNLNGSSVDNIVDAQGNLTAAYAEFIGTRGAQL